MGVEGICVCVKECVWCVNVEVICVCVRECVWCVNVEGICVCVCVRECVCGGDLCV